jgi:hypothetical protein
MILSLKKYLNAESSQSTLSYNLTYHKSYIKKFADESVGVGNDVSGFWGIILTLGSVCTKSCFLITRKVGFELRHNLSQTNFRLQVRSLRQRTNRRHNGMKVRGNERW